MSNANGSKAAQKDIGFMPKMSTKITLLIGGIVFLTVVVLLLVASSRASKSMEETYLNYSRNLAEEIANALASQG